MKKLTLCIILIMLVGCGGLSSTNCELEVRKKYEGTYIWVKKVGNWTNIVLLKDSTLLLVESKGLSDDYITKTDTIIKN